MLLVFAIPAAVSPSCFRMWPYMVYYGPLYVAAVWSFVRVLNLLFGTEIMARSKASVRSNAHAHSSPFMRLKFNDV